MATSTLTISFPDGTVSPFDLTQPSVTIGSGSQCTIILPHESVAETHAELSLDVTGYLVTDLVGGGVTLLNGYPLEKDSSYQLESGTQLQFGEVVAVYEQQVPEPAPAVAPSAPVDFPTPGSFPKRSHPAGLFVPLKKKVNPVMIGAVVLAVAAVGGALFAVFGVDIPLPR